MKNRDLLENYYLPDDLERPIGAFVEYYNNKRYHGSLNNFTPAEVYLGRDKGIIRETDNPTTPLATSKTSSIINHTTEPEPPMSKPL